MFKSFSRRTNAIVVVGALVAGTILSLSSPSVAHADDTYERICLTMGWTQCGEFTIHQADGTQVNRVVGPYPLDAFLAYDRSRVIKEEGGYALLVREITPTPEPGPTPEPEPTPEPKEGDLPELYRLPSGAREGPVGEIIVGQSQWCGVRSETQIHFYIGFANTDGDRRVRFSNMSFGYDVSSNGQTVSSWRSSSNYVSSQGEYVVCPDLRNLTPATTYTISAWAIDSGKRFTDSLTLTTKGTIDQVAPTPKLPSINGRVVAGQFISYAAGLIGGYQKDNWFWEQCSTRTSCSQIPGTSRSNSIVVPASANFIRISEIWTVAGNTQSVNRSVAYEVGAPAGTDPVEAGAPQASGPSISGVFEAGETLRFSAGSVQDYSRNGWFWEACDSEGVCRTISNTTNAQTIVVSDGLSAVRVSERWSGSLPGWTTFMNRSQIYTVATPASSDGDELADDVEADVDVELTEAERREGREELESAESSPEESLEVSVDASGRNLLSIGTNSNPSGLQLLNLPLDGGVDLGPIEQAMERASFALRGLVNAVADFSTPGSPEPEAGEVAAKEVSVEIDEEIVAETEVAERVTSESEVEGSEYMSPASSSVPTRFEKLVLGGFEDKASDAPAEFSFTLDEVIATDGIQQPAQTVSVNVLNFAVDAALDFSNLDQLAASLTEPELNLIADEVAESPLTGGEGQRDGFEAQLGETRVVYGSEAAVSRYPVAPAEVAQGTPINQIPYSRGSPASWATKRETVTGSTVEAGSTVVITETYEWYPFGERLFGVRLDPSSTVVQSEIKVVPFLTQMPVIQGNGIVGDPLSVAYEKHPLAGSGELVVWDIRLPSGRQIFGYGNEYVPREDHAGATVRAQVRATSSDDAPRYISDSITLVQRELPPDLVAGKIVAEPSFGVVPWEWMYLGPQFTFFELSNGVVDGYQLVDTKFEICGTRLWQTGCWDLPAYSWLDKLSVGMTVHSHQTFVLAEGYVGEPRVTLSATSSEVRPVANSKPKVVGTYTPGSTLRVEWDTTRESQSVYYQWQVRDGYSWKTIRRAYLDTYVVQESDRGKDVRVIVYAPSSNFTPIMPLNRQNRGGLEPGQIASNSVRIE